jgi:hypothetical protein
MPNFSNPATVEISCYKRSGDGLYWPRYPNGDKPYPSMYGGGEADSAAAGALRTGVLLKGSPSIISSASGVLSGGGTSKLRFNPGFYACFDYGGSGGASLGKAQTDAAFITNHIPATPANGIPTDNLTGLCATVSWRTFTNATQGVYDWTTQDTYVNAYRAQNKRYWIWLNPFYFVGSGRSITTGSRCVPDWLINQQGLNGSMGNYSTLGKGVFPKLYNAPVYNAMMAWFKACVDRYGPDPLCEGFAVGIGTSNASFNGVDNLGTQAPQINYNADYNQNGMIAAWKQMVIDFRAYNKVLQFWATTDYLFNAGGSDAEWAAMYDVFIANQAAMGGPDSWTQKWVYPQTPYSYNQSAAAGRPNPNPAYFRAITSDNVLRGWTTAKDYRGKIMHVGCQELTEMGGYIGQFGAADVWLTRGSALDDCHYMIFDINDSRTAAGTVGVNKAPNTMWDAGAAYEAQYGQGTYNFSKGAGKTNQVSPY